MARVGVCEDDPAIRRILQELLRRDEHSVTLAHNGSEAMKLFAAKEFDVLILDIGLPDADGRDVCQGLRAAGQDAPVLFLTAYDGRQDKIAGFTSGADDYVTKPFDVTEVRMRVNALSRRATAGKPASLGLTLDPLRHAVRCEAREALLSPTEFRMLGALIGRTGEVVRRAAVVASAWPDGAIVSDNTVDSYVRRLRVKLEQVHSPLAIHTVRGVGLTLR